MFAITGSEKRGDGGVPLFCFASGQILRHDLEAGATYLLEIHGMLGGTYVGCTVTGATTGGGGG